MYAHNVSEVNFNLLSSHDTERLLTTCQGNKQKVMLAYAFLMTQAGSACIYYGDEIGMDGENDPFCRRCMIWKEEKQDLQMLSVFKKLINLRKNHPSLRATSLEWMTVNDKENYVIFKKHDIDGKHEIKRRI